MMMATLKQALVSTAAATVIAAAGVGAAVTARDCRSFTVMMMVMMIAVTQHRFINHFHSCDPFDSIERQHPSPAAAASTAAARECE